MNVEYLLYARSPSEGPAPAQPIRDIRSRKVFTPARLHFARRPMMAPGH